MLNKVLVAGGGVLGSQIALQNAVHGKQVTVYDVADDAITKAKQRIENYKDLLVADMEDISDQDATARIATIKYTTDLAAGLADIDLVIEAVPESMHIKEDFWTKASKAAPEKTIFATNSSTLLPSNLVKFVDRPGKFLAFHFANLVWKHNTIEVMGHAGTDAQVVTTLHDFAREIGMVPIMIKKENPGYVLNGLLNPMTNAALIMWYTGVADYETIDRTCLIDLEIPMGPFGSIDMIGLRTICNVLSAYEQDSIMYKIGQKIQKEFVDQGKLGTETGEGFYKYPNPAFEQADFVK